MPDSEFIETDETDVENAVKDGEREAKNGVLRKILAVPKGFLASSLKPLKGFIERIGFLNRLFQYLKTHRLISLLVSVGAVVLIVLLILMNRPSTGKIISREGAQAQLQYSRVSIMVPEGAYAGGKSFQVIEIKEGTQEYLKYKELADFEGPIYKILPADGRDELALKPIRIRYRLDPSVYPGDEFVHFVLRYVTLTDPPVVTTINGCEIRGDSERYVEGLVFHASFVVGLAFKKPEYADFGIKLALDRPPTLKPDILIVPGIDQNFCGVIPNTQTSDNPAGSNFWGLLFPDRSIWIYNYPLITTRPRNYTRALEKHFATSPVPSYITFEAKRLAVELKRLSSRTFDVIAQGIGGLIVRYAIESDPSITNVRSVALLSVPNSGSNVTNTIYLSQLYGKPVSDLAEIFGVEADDMAFLISSLLGTLEKVNAYWNEILPSSRVVESLKKYGMRSDVRYLFIGGTKPPGSIQIQGTELARFFPEFVESAGDGFVTVESAVPENAGENIKAMIFPYSFQDIYLKNDVLQALKDFFASDIEIPEVPEFKDDNFVETTVKPSLPSEKWSPYSLTKLETGNVLQLLWRIEVPEIGYPVETTSGLYIVGRSGVFLRDSQTGTWKKITSDQPLSFEVMDNGALLLCYEDRVEMVSGSSKTTLWRLNTEGVLTDAYFVDKSRGFVVVSTPSGTLLLYISDGKVEKSEKTGGAYAELKPSGDLLLLITDTAVRAIKKDNFEKLWEINESEMIKRLGLPEMAGVDPMDAEIAGDDLFVLFRNYMIGVFHLKSNNAQVVASGETGAEKLLKLDGRIFVLGDESITGFNTLSRLRFPYYQKVQSKLWYPGRNELLLSFEEGGRAWVAAYSSLF
ncbi:MAG: hypothetical protein PWP37_789 [Thermotogota bacterium]|nr:hypothetical protein [Thermotogota bacterium]MDK2864597.1 hypothetical protein [Thermotogota bacterium]